MKKIFFLLLSISIYSQNLFPFKENSLWGYKNENSKVVIKPEYYLAKKFINDYAIVGKNDSLGIINKENKVILPFKFNMLQYLNPTTYLYGYQSKYFGEFSIGIIDLNGNKLTPPLYYNINFRDNKYFVTIKNDKEILDGPLSGMKEDETKYGVLDINGKTLIPVVYDYSKSVDFDRIVMTDQKNNMEILFDNRGNKLTNEKFNSINLFYDGISDVRINSQCGYINKEGKIIIPVSYSACYPFYKDKAIVSQNFKFVIIDKNANPLTESLSYEEMKKYLESQQLQIMFDDFRFMNRKN